MTPANSVPFAEHVSELRKRFMWILLFVAIGGAVGYALHDRLMFILQMPLHDTLYYNTPTGAFSFVMKLCVVFGLIVALPALSYHTFAFFGPIIAKRTKRSTILYITMSVILACAGMAFAYFVSLPASLHFLTTFGNSGDIEALITANEYFNFVLAYVAGFAVLFQVPLIIMFINRVKPLPPRQLLGATRYVIVASFIAAAIITPTPDPMNQAIMAGPIIALYLLSVLVVAVHPKRFKQKKLNRMTQQRVQQKIKGFPLLKPVVTLVAQPLQAARPQMAFMPVTQKAPKPTPQGRLISDFMPRKLASPQPRQFVDITARRPIVQA